MLVYWGVQYLPMKLSLCSQQKSTAHLDIIQSHTLWLFSIGIDRPQIHPEEMNQTSVANHWSSKCFPPRQMKEKHPKKKNKKNIQKVKSI